MSAKKIIPLLLLVITHTLLAIGQPASGAHLFATFPDSVPIAEIIRQTNALPPNVPKVRQLLGISHIYRDQGRSRNLDTGLRFLNEAYAVGNAIHDTPGITDARAQMCEIYMLKGDVSSAVALLKPVFGEARIQLLLTIAEGYVDGQPVDLSSIEKALPFLSSATRLADSLRSARWRNECLMVRAWYFFQHGDIENGKNAILAIIKSCDSLGDKKAAGHYWLEMDSCMPYVGRATQYHLFACRQAIRAYTEAGDQPDALYALRSLANRHRYIGQYDTAEREFMLFLRESAKLGITPSAYTNFRVGLVYAEGGNPAKGLDYMLRALERVGRDGALKKRIHLALAVIYQLTGISTEELNYGRLLVEEGIRFRDANLHYYTTFVIEALVKAGDPEKALAWLQEFNAANPAHSLAQQTAIAYNYGLIYDGLGDYRKAAPWFQRLMNLDTAAVHERNSTVYGTVGVDPFLVHIYTARFYVHSGKYQQAKPILVRALASPLPYKGFADGGELQLLLYKVDSANGDLRAAINDYLRYAAVKDSMFNLRKMQQLQTLQVQYQTKQQEQSLLLLKSESQRQRAELNEASFIRKITFGSIILLLILAAWAYSAYQAKRRNFQQLMAQQLVINEKNHSLQQLLGEKNELLTEKNLLLQEVHHRVKNNLHTVMSLLESQSAYLSDKAVRNVLLDSQNRIHTISLLHQKLYWANNVTSLEMGPYIAELSTFLASSLGARERRITISQSVEPIVLDLSLALPIGLLLNEAITNALKHAFPDNADQNAARPGHISVTMRHEPDGLVSLEIVDDGVGMPNSKGASPNSLGMTLMTSIGQKLGGRFTIHSSDNGVRIGLVFKSAEVFA